MYQINPSQVTEIVSDLYRNDTETVLCFVGHMGIGKTVAVRQAAKDVGARCEFVSAGNDSPETFSGIPDTGVADAIAGKKPDLIMKWRMPEWVGPACSEEGCILFIDEVNHGSMEVLNHVYNVIEEGKKHIRGLKLSEKTLVVAAMNPDDGFYPVNELNPSFERRLLFIEVVFDRDSFIGHIREKQWQPSLISFLSTHEKMIWTDPSKFEGKQPPTPAGWATVNRLMQRGVIKESEISSWKAGCLISGKVGEGAYGAFQKYVIEEYSRPVDGKKLMTGYKKVAKDLRKDHEDGKSDRVAVTCQSIVDCLVAGDVPKNAFPNLAEFLTDEAVGVGHRTALIVKIIKSEKELSEAGKEVLKQIYADTNLCRMLNQNMAKG